MGRSVLCFVLIISLTLAAPYHEEEDDDYYDYNPEETDQGPPERVIIAQPPNRPVSTYEVTENVVDIPNPNQQSKFVVANYTTAKNLNVVPGITNKTDQQVPKNVDNLTPKQINVQNYFDFDKETPDADYEEESDSHEEFHDINNIIPSLREYLNGLKKGFIDGLHSLVGRAIFDVDRNAEPIFIEKLQKKSNFAKNSKHYGHEFDDC